MKLSTRSAGRWALPTVLALLVLLGAFGWYIRKSPAVPVAAPDSLQPTAVSTTHPTAQVWRRELELPGQIEAFEQTPVFAKIAGYVRKWHIDIGGRVRAGDLLAEIDVPEMVEELHQKEAGVALAAADRVQVQRALRAADANLKKTEAALLQAEAGKARAESNVIRYKADLERVRKLLPIGASDAQTRDAVVDQLRSAEAALEESKAAIQLARAARDESEALRDRASAQVQVAEARVRVAEADRRHTAAILKYAEIRAPFDGVVARRYVESGHFVQPATNANANGTPLFVVVRTDTVRLFVDVPEAEAVRVEDDTPVRVRVQALQDQEFPARVARSSWSLDTQTRTLRTQIDLPNADGRLRPGMYAAARLAVSRTGTLALPASAVLTFDDQPAIVLAIDGIATRRAVKLGQRQGSWVEVLKVKAGPDRRGEPSTWDNPTGREEVVTTNPGAVADGQAVQMQPTGSRVAFNP